RALAAVVEAGGDRGDVPGEEEDHPDGEHETAAPGVGPQDEPEAAVEEPHAQQRAEEAAEVGRRGHRPASSPTSARTRSRRISALMRHIGSPTPGMVPDPA